jgi:hypothetical protein
MPLLPGNYLGKPLLSRAYTHYHPACPFAWIEGPVAKVVVVSITRWMQTKAHASFGILIN